MLKAFQLVKETQTDTRSIMDLAAVEWANLEIQHSALPSIAVQGFV